MNENTLKNRWTELCFAFLIYDLQAQLNDYPFVVEYIELLADLSQIDRQLALKAITSVSGMNTIHYSRAEVIYLAKHFKISDRVLCKKLHMSNEYFHRIKSSIVSSEEFYIQTQSSDANIKVMETLLKTHNKLKGIGMEYD